MYRISGIKHILNESLFFASEVLEESKNVVMLGTHIKLLVLALRAPKSVSRLCKSLKSGWIGSLAPTALFASGSAHRQMIYRQPQNGLGFTEDHAEGTNPPK
jgi:hypothetical protein